jgi:acetyl esterase/lipase
MKIDTPRAQRANSFLFVLAFLCLGTAAAEEGKVWTVGPRKIPLPLGASAELRQSIAATPQPDVKAVGSVSPKSASDWEKIIAPRDQAAAEANHKLAKAWSIRVEETKIAGVPAFKVTSSKPDPALADKLFVHTHGGAYVFNQGWAGLHEAILIAERVGVPVLSIDYRMPPEAPYPAAIDDVIAVWRELLRKRKASSMAIGGTSAGGNLALVSVLRMKQLKLPLPAAVMASTPWADLDGTGDSNFVNEGIDRMLVTQEGLLAAAARLYADGADLKGPFISPVYGDFAEFPPSILFTGTRDLFLSGTVRTHRNMRAAGVDAEMHVFEAMSHGGWMIQDFPESRTFTTGVGAFLERHMK